MSSIQVRPFRRGDREQLTRLVNVNAAAAIPGMSVSVNTVMASSSASRVSSSSIHGSSTAQR
jgi:hypothetical protein